MSTSTDMELLPYDEEAWTAKRKETLERIKETTALPIR